MSEKNPAHVPSRKSICIVTQSYSFGGTEVHTLGVIEALIERGRAIDIIACQSHHEYDKAIAASGWRDHVSLTHTDLDVNDTRPDAFQRWKQLLGTKRTDIVIFPKGEAEMGNLAFLRACKRIFRKIIFIEHLEAKPPPEKVSRRLFGFIPAGLGLWWYRQLLTMRLRTAYADRIIAVSEKVKQRLVNDWGIVAKKVVVIRNGVRWQDFSRDEAQGAAFRVRHGIPVDAVVFGMATRLARVKAIDIALQALRLLLDKGTGREVYLVIAGAGEQAENLTRLTADLGLEAHVRFIGFVNETWDLLSSYDVILFPSRREGLPLGLLEGMAAGCLPIVTRISGMPEVVNSPDLGWVVEVEDPADLCGAMRDFLGRDAAQLAQMRGNVVRRVREHFDVAECHRRIVVAIWV